MKRCLFTSLTLGAVCSLWAGCDSKEKDPCPQGICVADGAAPDGVAGDGAPPVGDADPRKDGKVPGRDGCTPKYFCGPWTTDGKTDQATRTCKDQSGCVSQAKVEKATLPALDFEYYKCNVQPIADRTCSMIGCHGASRPYRVFARGRQRNNEVVPTKSCTSKAQCTGIYRFYTCTSLRGGGPPGRFCAPCNGYAPATANLDTMGSGNIECWGWGPLSAAEWRKNYDSARAFMLKLTAANVDQSELLKQVVAGGLPHAGVHPFASKNDPNYKTLRAWLGGAKLGKKCNTGKN